MKGAPPLRQAEERLAHWCSRTRALRKLASELDPRDRERVAPYVQELSDTCNQAENMMLRLARSHPGDAQLLLDPIWQRMKATWHALSRVLDRVA